MEECEKIVCCFIKQIEYLNDKPCNQSNNNTEYSNNPYTYFSFSLIAAVFKLLGIRRVHNKEQAIYNPGDI